MNRSRLFLTIAGALVGLTFGLAATASGSSGTTGVTNRLITIGGTFPMSGPASLYSGIAGGARAYFAYVNDRGGVNHRQIKFLALDDGYNPANTVQLTHQLVEQDGVFAIVGSLGTETNLATRSYLNEQKVPQVLLSTGASTWGTDYKQYPWTIGWQPDYIAEGYIYGKFIVDKVPQAKIGVLYQNDAYGQDYITGLKKGLGDQAGKIVDMEGYEVTSSDVASQVAKLAASGANTLLVAATPTFAIQSVVISHQLGWHPTIFMNSISATDTLMGLAAKSAGADAVNGIISIKYWMDPASPQYAKPGSVDLYKQILAKYASNLNPNDAFVAYGMAEAWTFVEALEQAGSHPTRAGLMNALLHLDTKDDPFLLPGMRLYTTPTDHFPLSQGVLVKFQDGSFHPFGHLLAYPRTSS